MKKNLFASISVLALSAALLVPLAAHAQASYASPEAAADAMIEAISTSNNKALTHLLGKNWRALLPPDGVDPKDRQAFLDKVKERRAVTLTDSRGELVVGNDPWAFPIPLVRTSAGQWRFDPVAGKVALLERRIGANERACMQAALAYVDAQRDYASADRNGDGVFEYARKLISTKGKRDGLIWSPTLGDDSPLGQDYVSSQPGYHGYRFKILEGQGPNAPGGARSYVIGNRLMSGYALIAWPIKYGETGVMSFIVNQDGVLYERDLGPNTESIAKGTKLFDPGKPWAKVTP